MYTQRILIFQAFLCLVLVLSLSFSDADPVEAQGLSITYGGQTVTCSSITVTYTVTGASNPPGSVLVEAIVNGSPLTNNDGPASNGMHMVTLNFATQRAGTMIYGRIRDASNTVQGTPEACGGVISTDTPTPQPSNTPVPTVSGSSPTPLPATNTPDDAPPWSGYFDGRLNPDPAEYYSIWCQYDLIEIYRSVPESELLKNIALRAVVDLSVGDVLDPGDFMTLVRNTSDVITIYGSNGNSAPDSGQKSFSLSECIARNGGLPPIPPPPDDALPGDDDSSSSDYSLCSDPEIFEIFVESCLAELGFNDLGILLNQLWLFCSGQLLAPFGVVIGSYCIARRRRRN
ncbi:MAG: hypothetical protein L0154_09105 [Chloroflexi bacterium]|nr:hypothetical protein [Chloroflexota bacterium]